VGDVELSIGDDYESELGLLNEISRNLEFFSDFHSSLFDVNEKFLKPLYRIETTENELRVVVDLPFVSSRKDLSLSSTDQSLTIEAKMRRPVSLLVGGPYQRRIEFERYCAAIQLPRKVRPSSAKAKFNRGILVVSFPSIKPKRRVTIK
jgi:HSP20 family molecular chaperone IbpA